MAPSNPLPVPPARTAGLAAAAPTDTAGATARSTAPASHQVPDRCPGALRPFPAADGLIARVRLAGSPLSAEQVRGIGALATELGDGQVYFTTRANVQVRALTEDQVPAFAQRAADLGLLPSPTHERVRNIVVSPCCGEDLLDLARALDAEICARPALAGLSGRFLVGLDDGTGELLALPLDISAQVRGGRVAIGLGSDPRGYDAGPLTDPAAVAAVLADVAGDILTIVTDEGCWNVDDLSLDGTDELHALVEGRLPAAPSLYVQRTVPTLAGAIDGDPGTVWLAARAPLAAIPAAGWAVAADLADQARGRLRVTPWHAIVIEGYPADQADAALARLAATGWVVSPESAWVDVHGCTGRPRCARALSDVQEQTRDLVDALGDVQGDVQDDVQGGGICVMLSGCERVCGHPPVPHVSAVAVGEGRYALTQADGTHGPQPAPFAVVATADLPHTLAEHAAAHPEVTR